MDLLHALTARYCIRQDARGFIELWALVVALTGAALTTLLSARGGTKERTQRLVIFFWPAILTIFACLTIGLALTIFRWCYESATATLGMVQPDAPRNLDAMSCLSLHALETIDGWIVIVISTIAAIALIAIGTIRLKNKARRALTYAGALIAVLLAVATGGFTLFGIAWCQSTRLF